MCPDCGGNVLEEIMVDVTVASTLVDVDPSGDVDYGEQINDGGVIDRFQCEVCGWIVPNCTSKEIKHVWLVQ